MRLNKIVLLVLLLILADSLANESEHELAKTTIAAETADTTSNEYLLTADGSGHFAGNVLINHYSMPFVIDTGATTTSIPMNLAVEARLPLGKQVEFITAGGRAFGRATQISQLQIGNLEIMNIQSHVNQHLPFVLIGMNTLKYLEMQQSGNQLKLSINPKYLKLGQLDNGVKVAISADNNTAKPVLDSAEPANPITKTKVCDANNHCVIKYGN